MNDIRLSKQEEDSQLEILMGMSGFARYYLKCLFPLDDHSYFLHKVVDFVKVV